jgi:hypothetical protein
MLSVLYAQNRCGITAKRVVIDSHWVNSQNRKLAPKAIWSINIYFESKNQFRLDHSGISKMSVREICPWLSVGKLVYFLDGEISSESPHNISKT